MEKKRNLTLKIKAKIVFILVAWRKYRIYVAIGSACPIQIQLRE